MFLVHALEEPFDAIPTDLESVTAIAKNLLHNEAERLRALGAQVTEECVLGFADATLIESAERHSAGLLIVSSLGRRAPARWLLGSVAERVAEGAAIPTLVIRAAAPFEAWAGGTPLKIVVGADFSTSSDSAIRLASIFQKAGPCAITVAHIASPAGHILPESGEEAMSIDLKPEYQETLENALRTKVEKAIGQPDKINVQVTPNWGRVDNALILVAGELKSDLIIVGTHRRHGVALAWHGSVSRGVLHHATVSVGCAPG
jgi:universal stress protein A